MKRLLKYLKGYEKETILAPLFKMLEATFELIVPLVVAGIVDVGIKNRDTEYIWRACILMVALGLIGLVCSLSLLSIFPREQQWDSVQDFEKICFLI